MAARPPPPGPTLPTPSGGDGGFIYPKRRRRRDRTERDNGTVVTPPRRLPQWGGWGSRASGRLGSPPPCQVLVKFLPPDFPEEELTAYVKEMLQDDRVEVRELWRGRGSSAFVVSAPGKYLSTLLQNDNWDEHVFVRQYFPPRSAAAAPSHPGSYGR